MALPKELGVMCPADSIIGFVQQADGKASVKEYYLDVGDIRRFPLAVMETDRNANRSMVLTTALIHKKDI